jgi:hypothetical protein
LKLPSNPRASAGRAWHVSHLSSLKNHQGVVDLAVAGPWREPTIDVTVLLARIESGSE